jgi:hypothetical protein
MPSPSHSSQDLKELMRFTPRVFPITQFPDHPITRSTDDAVPLPLIPRSKGLMRFTPMWHSPGSTERAGFACAGVEAPLAVGFESHMVVFSDHPISRSSDHPITRSTDDAVPLPLIPRSKGLMRFTPMWHSPGSTERAGFACAGAQPPSAEGLLEATFCIFPITRSSDHAINRSRDLN